MRFMLHRKSERIRLKVKVYSILFMKNLHLRNFANFSSFGFRLAGRVLELVAGIAMEARKRSRAEQFSDEKSAHKIQIASVVSNSCEGGKTDEEKEDAGVKEDKHQFWRSVNQCSRAIDCWILLCQFLRTLEQFPSFKPSSNLLSFFGNYIIFCMS
ncbi:hypothetical protein SUGI_0334240 [Cryptomeria japonica]|nr:hypothetical protein SUGI_0334240 [Cryptomeria japonica]